MSVDNNNEMKPEEFRRKSDFLILDTYHAVKELSSKVEKLSLTTTEEKLKQAHSESEIKEFKEGLKKLTESVEQLKLTEAKSTIKFGILTFVATLIFVTMFNFFMSSFSLPEESRIIGMLPPKTEISLKRKDNDQWWPA